MSSLVSESPQPPRGGGGALRRLQRRSSRSGLASKMAAAVSGLQGQLVDLRDNTSKFDLPALLSEKKTTHTPSTLVSQPVSAEKDNGGGGGSAEGTASMSLTEFLAATLPTPTRATPSRRSRPTPPPSVEVDADLLRALDAVTSASASAGADVRNLRLWRSAVHSTMLTLADSHPQHSQFRATAEAAAAAKNNASTIRLPHHIRRKPAPAMTQDEQCALNSHDSGWTRTEVEPEEAGWTAAHVTSSSLSSPSSFASTSSHITDDKQKPPIKLTAPRPSSSSSSAQNVTRPEWTTMANLPHSPVTPTARHFSNVGDRDENLLRAMRFDSMLMGIRGTMMFSDELSEPEDDKGDNQEGPAGSHRARQASVSSSVEDVMATPDLGYASSITSSSQDEEEPKCSAPKAQSRMSSLTPASRSSMEQPLRPLRSPDRCRVHVPVYIGKSVRDQRWTPFSSVNHAEEEDDVDEDDHESDLRPYGAPPLRKKDTTMDMLDFLNSGPPM